MQNKLIESVRALAEAQRTLNSGMCATPERYFRAWEVLADTDAIPFPALLAALERAERIEKAWVNSARRVSFACARWLDDFIADSDLVRVINEELDAALSEPK